MKKLILIALAFISLNHVFAQQQTTGTPEERAKIQTDKLEKMLSLTADQKTKVYNVALITNNTIKRHIEDHKNDTDKTVLNDRIRSTKQAFVNEVNSILTPEQKAKWKAVDDE